MAKEEGLTMNQFPPRNEVLQWFNHKFCSWGKRRPNKSYTKKTLGSTAPLWRHPKASFYKFFFISNIISSLIFILFYITILIYNGVIESDIGTSNNNTNSNPSTQSTTDSTNTGTNSNNPATDAGSTDTDVKNRGATDHIQSRMTADTTSGTENDQTRTTGTNESLKGEKDQNKDCLDKVGELISPEYIIVGSSILFFNGR